MARAGIYKSEVVRARDKLLAIGRYPSIDAVREELGNTGSKGTIHRYLKEIEEEEGSTTTGPRVAVSEAIQDLVERLAARINEEGAEQVTQVQVKHAAQLSELQNATAVLKNEAQTTRVQLEQTQQALADERAKHSKTAENLNEKILQCTQLTQQVADLQERVAAEEGHRQSLEEKHQHARQALEHFRESTKEQRDQEQRKHEQQVQYLQTELRTLNETLATKQHENTHAHQENARLVGELSRAQSDLHQSQEEVRALRPLKDTLEFAQKRVEELGRRLVEQESVAKQVNNANNELKTQVDHVLKLNQQLELELATAKASMATQAQIMGSVLEQLKANLSKTAKNNLKQRAGNASPADLLPFLDQAATETPPPGDEKLG